MIMPKKKYPMFQLGDKLSGISPGRNAKTWSDVQDAESPSPSPASNSKGGISPSSSFETVPPHRDDRTLLLTRLPQGTTYKDITDVVRGGRILDVHMRDDRTSTVTFIDGAAEFLAHAKRFGVYINSHRIDVQWNARQFPVPLHMANRIENGATRNVVIRGAARRLSEERVRRDMEHIHRLVIVEIAFRGRDLVVCANSVYTAAFMKSCMMSRRDYKGMRIDWFPDECADPLPLPTVRRGPPIPALRRPRQARADQTRRDVSNMFALLEEDPSECSDEASASDVCDLISPDGLPVNWATAMRI